MQLEESWKIVKNQDAIRKNEIGKIGLKRRCGIGELLMGLKRMKEEEEKAEIIS